MRYDELLKQKGKIVFQETDISLPGFAVSNTDTTPGLAFVRPTLEQIMTSALAGVKEIQDSAVKKADNREIPQLVAGFSQFASNLLNGVQTLLNVPLEVIKNALARFLPDITAETRDAILRGAAKGLIRGVQQFVNDSLKAADEASKGNVEALGTVSEAPKNIIDYVIEGAAEEMKRTMEKSNQKLSTALTNAILHEIEKGLTAVVQKLDLGVDKVALTDIGETRRHSKGGGGRHLELPKLTEDEAKQIVLDELGNMLPAFKIDQLQDSKISMIPQADFYIIYLENDSGWKLNGRLVPTEDGGWMLDVYSGHDPNVHYSINDLMNSIPPDALSKLEDWKLDFEQRAPEMGLYVSGYDYDEPQIQMDYQGGELLVLDIWPNVRDEPPEYYELIWTINPDGSLEFLGGQPMRL